MCTFAKTDDRLGIDELDLRPKEVGSAILEPSRLNRPLTTALRPEAENRVCQKNAGGFTRTFLRDIDSGFSQQFYQHAVRRAVRPILSGLILEGPLIPPILADDHDPRMKVAEPPGPGANVSGFEFATAYH
jgi:hypothetical protein